jgi:hypothetical protein
MICEIITAKLQAKMSASHALSLWVVSSLIFCKWNAPLVGCNGGVTLQLNAVNKKSVSVAGASNCLSSSERK